MNSPIKISATRVPGDSPVRVNESVQQMIQTILAQPDGQYLITVNRRSVVKVQEVSVPIRQDSGDASKAQKTLKARAGAKKAGAQSPAQP